MRFLPTFLACAVALCAQEASDFAGLRLRSIGPALMSGRIVQIAVHPQHKATWYVAVASGGVWKTTNAGTTWTPVFDREGSYSVGAVTIDPRYPDTIWVGSGEANNQRSVGWGDGVYRSDDGGKSWKNLGLKQSEHIGRIIVDPRDSRVVYVAAYGPLWSAGGDRGLYKTADGGKNWKRILEISENTGAAEVALDPNNPDIVLASAHQRRRHVWTLIHGGPESALYKSTDAGATFQKITSGLPSGDLGRIGFMFSPAQQGLVYARVEAAGDGSGTYRSLNSGESWEKMSSYVSQSMYYGKIVADPNVADRVYMMDVVVRVSNDAGRTWTPVGERNKHVDTHDYWLDPSNSDHIIAGCDGGLYESWDRGRIWRHFTNLPVTQFYNVEVDNAAPIYNVYGGTQDNSTLGGPSRTFGVDGAVNNDWIIVTGGDGFVARIDPTNPDIVYAESQYGGLVRLNRKTGERLGIKPVEGKGEPPLRFNWESPFLISPHNPARLYFGSSRLLRSDDRGESWRPVSGDLTRQIDRNQLPVMGRIWPPEAVAKHQSTSTYGNITALSESRKKEGLIYVGTDDGLVQVTEDGGKTWRKAEKFPGLPETSPYGVYVQRLYASKHDDRTVYVLFDNHKNGDYKPYLLKSADRGATWTSVSGDLPAIGPVLSLAEDHADPNLLFAGTEFGLFFTRDGGKKWLRLRGGLPTIAVRDLAIQERENDLVLGTFGRGFYVLDDYSPLRTATPETLSKNTHVFPVKTARLYVPDTGSARGSQGAQLYKAVNPPFGAVITYWLKEPLQTAKQRRVNAAKESEKKKETPKYPVQSELTAEADEEAPLLILTIMDADGKVVKRVTGPVTKGIHRVAWNLRGPSPSAVPAGRRGGSDDDDDGGVDRSGGGYVAPGSYKVSLASRIDSVTTPSGAAQTFQVEADPALEIKPESTRDITEFQQKAYRLQRAYLGALEEANNAKARLTAIRRALLDSGADVKWLDETAALDRRITASLRKLRGDETLRGLESGSPSTIGSRIGSAVQGTRNRTAAPTGTQKQNFDISAEEFAGEQSRLSAALSDLTKLEKALDAAGVPWTSGRTPSWR